MAKNTGSSPFFKLDMCCFVTKGNQKQVARDIGMSRSMCEVEMCRCSPPWIIHTLHSVSSTQFPFWGDVTCLFIFPQSVSHLGDVCMCFSISYTGN